MASGLRQESNDEDIVSACGSISGETFVSRLSRRPGCSLRQRPVDKLAKNLRDFNFDDQDPNCKNEPNGCRLSIVGLDQKPKFNKIFHHYRFLVAMFGGSSIGFMFVLRYNITISILNMVNQTHLYLTEHPNNTVEDMIAEGYIPGGDFNWNNEIQQMIMSWYMVAYCLPQIPATKLATLIGVRYAIPGSLFICSLSTILVPTLAHYGWQYVIFLRLINGLGASCILPMLLTLIEGWMRHDEISLGLSLAQILTTLLAATNPLIAGYLSSIHWCYSFYVPGYCGIVFCILWLILITDNPIDNYFVSEKELAHICECGMIDAMPAPEKKQTSNLGKKKNNDSDKQVEIQDDGLDYKPESWTQILRVPSFYAYIVIWCLYCCSYSGFAFVLPLYLRQFLKIKISQNGFYCFVVQCGGIFATLWPHPLLRLLEEKFKFSKVTATRITHLVCCSVPAATWIYIGTFHENQLALLFLNKCFHNGNDIIVTAGIMSNYAKAGLSSLVFSMVNTMGNMSVVFASTFFGWLLDYTAKSNTGWAIILIYLGITQLVMWLLFCTLVRPEPVRFNNDRLNKHVESKLQRSVSAQFEEPPSLHELNGNKSGALNNFDKLKDQQNNDQQRAPQESKQI